MVVVQQVLHPTSLLSISVCTFVLNLSVLPSTGNTKNKEIAPSEVNYCAPELPMVVKIKFDLDKKYSMFEVNYRIWCA
jgi:hypothetical protein